MFWCPYKIWGHCNPISPPPTPHLAICHPKTPCFFLCRIHPKTPCFLNSRVTQWWNIYFSVLGPKRKIHFIKYFNVISVSMKDKTLIFCTKFEWKYVITICKKLYLQHISPAAVRLGLCDKIWQCLGRRKISFKQDALLTITFWVETWITTKLELKL